MGIKATEDIATPLNYWGKSTHRLGVLWAKAQILPRKMRKSSVRTSRAPANSIVQRSSFASATPLASPCPGMGSVVHFCQMLEIQVGIHLGGGNIGVAEQFLDSTNIAARLKQVAGK